MWLPSTQVGLPKSGSNSIKEFFKCHNMSQVHWREPRRKKSEFTFFGDATHACDERGQRLLDCGPCFDVYAQIDLEHPPDHCYLPQITHLEALILDYGNATFLLPTRSAASWASSVERWGHLALMFSKCQLPSVGAPRNGSTAALAEFHTKVYARARAILVRAEKRTGLRWVEFDITSPTAGSALAATVPGGGRPACWGAYNVHPKVR